MIGFVMLVAFRLWRSLKMNFLFLLITWLKKLRSYRCCACSLACDFRRNSRFGHELHGGCWKKRI